MSNGLALRASLPLSGGLAIRPQIYTKNRRSFELRRYFF